jgi:hypothetical protein
MPASKIIKNATFDCFKSSLKAKLPMFQPVIDKALNNAGSGFSRRVWKWQFHPFLVFFISILYSGKWDEFYVEGAWSEKGRWPSKLTPGTPRTVSEVKMIRSPAVDGEFLFRMQELWDPQGDDAWEIEYKTGLERAWKEHTLWKPTPTEELLKRIPSLVDDAVQKTSEFAIPYFREIAVEHGYEIELVK